jgi:RNA polymerase sigma-70 factor (ECF subfamily)
MNRRATRAVHGVWALSDESLLAGMASRDADAATAFVRRYQARVFGLALTIVGSRTVAEDVAQEAFVRAWRHAESYDPRKGRVPAWLLTITRNLAIDAVRMRGELPTDPFLLMGSLVSREGDTESSMDYDDRENLRRALLALPPEQARAIALSVFYGLTGKEIAAVEEIPLGTAKTRIRRGLGKLREVLGVHDE